jgi:hypothetical protein
MVDETIPPDHRRRYAAHDFEPVPLPTLIGSRPAMIATTVIIFGRTRSTAPSMIAA